MPGPQDLISCPDLTSILCDTAGRWLIYMLYKVVNLQLQNLDQARHAALRIPSRYIAEYTATPRAVPARAMLERLFALCADDDTTPATHITNMMNMLDGVEAEDPSESEESQDNEEEAESEVSIEDIEDGERDQAIAHRNHARWGEDVDTLLDPQGEVSINEDGDTASESEGTVCGSIDGTNDERRLRLSTREVVVLANLETGFLRRIEDALGRSQNILPHELFKRRSRVIWAYTALMVEYITRRYEENLHVAAEKAQTVADKAETKFVQAKEQVQFSLRYMRKAWPLWLKETVFDHETLAHVCTERD